MLEPVVSSIVHPSGTVLATCGAANRAVPTARHPGQPSEGSAPDSARGTDASGSESDSNSVEEQSDGEREVHGPQAALKLWSVS